MEVAYQIRAPLWFHPDTHNRLLRILERSESEDTIASDECVRGWALPNMPSISPRSDCTTLLRMQPKGFDMIELY